MKIKGFPDYSVNNKGEVFKGDKKLATYDNGQGYRQVKLYKNGKRYTKNVHRLVMGEPNSDVDHINSNKADNSAGNLQKLSHSENVKRIFKK